MGVDSAEQVAKDTAKVREETYAAIKHAAVHCEAEAMVDQEEIPCETKVKR